MITSFKHKGLKQLFEQGKKQGIKANHSKRLQLILSLLNEAKEPTDLDLPGLDLHPLKGQRKNFWAVKVSGNWRVTFTFHAGHARAVNYEDYH